MMFTQALQHQMSQKYQSPTQVYPTSQSLPSIPGVLTIVYLVLSLISTEWKSVLSRALKGEKKPSCHESEFYPLLPLSEHVFTSISKCTLLNADRWLPLRQSKVMAYCSIAQNHSKKVLESCRVFSGAVVLQLGVILLSSTPRDIWKCLETYFLS